MSAKRAIKLVLIVLMMVPLSAAAQAQEDVSWLPAPSGNFQVGTAFYHWIDETRSEVMTDALLDRRELVVRFWYPAEVAADASPVTYFPAGEKEIEGFRAAQDGFIATVQTDVVAETPSYSFLDAPLSEAEPTYPVLVFSPGVPGTPSMSTAQLQNLASSGYIIAAINHPYISGWTIFPDGHMVVSRVNDATIQTAVETMVKDQTFVLDQLEALNADSTDKRFSGRLDLEHIATFGKSAGSWAAAMASLADARFRAVLLEGPHEVLPYPVIDAGLDVPVMFLDPNGENSAAGFQAMRGPTYRVSLNGISDLNMADFLLWPGMVDGVPPELVGDVAPDRSIQVVNAYVQAFFDQYLKGEEQPLLQGLSDEFPEVVIESRNLDD